MVNRGTPNPCFPAISNTYGNVEITLDPNMLLTQTATPKVITYSETNSNTCCQRNETIWSFLLIFKIYVSTKAYKSSA